MSVMFEGIAKTNTTNTIQQIIKTKLSLRVLLKQIQQTQESSHQHTRVCLRVLLKQIQQTPETIMKLEELGLRVLLKQIQQTHDWNDNIEDDV